MRRLAALALLCAAFVSPSALPQAPRPPFERRWVFVMCNLLVDQQAGDVAALIGRAGRCGYNGVVLSDYKFNILAQMPERYFRNAARVRQAAEAAGVEVIPCVFPIGTSNGLLAHDPNLAEGVEVRDQPFVANGRTAVPAADFTERLVNGGLEQAQGNTFAGFSFQDGPGRTTFVDRDEVHGGKRSCRLQAGREEAGNARLVQTVRVRPNACYRFSAWVKTRDLQPANVRLLALGKSFGRRLTFQEPALRPTQDWTQIDATFNTLDDTEVTLYAGQWGGRGGTFWLDDLALEELTLVNVLRRPGCPLTVTGAGGQTVYEEGTDFLPVRDPKLGQTPYAGEFDFRHPGATLELTPDSRIRDGQRLRVSWYHPVIIHEGQVMCCLAEPKVAELLRDQARRVNDLFKPKTFFLSHDEVRVLGWCKACRESRKTPGELLAANARRCAEIVKEVSPSARVAVWSDMFDPYHNAVRSGYYLVNGPLTNSWQGLAPEVTVVNWNSAKPAESLKWFAEQGHAQVIAGFYDGPPEGLRKWQEAARSVPGVGGFMYTTWQGDYSQLEAYGKVLRGE